MAFTAKYAGVTRDLAELAVGRRKGDGQVVLLRRIDGEWKPVSAANWPMSVVSRVARLSARARVALPSELLSWLRWAPRPGPWVGFDDQAWLECLVFLEDGLRDGQR